MFDAMPPNILFDLYDVNGLWGCLMTPKERCEDEEEKVTRACALRLFTIGHAYFAQMYRTVQPEDADNGELWRRIFQKRINIACTTPFYDGAEMEIRNLLLLITGLLRTFHFRVSSMFSPLRPGRESAHTVKKPFQVIAAFFETTFEKNLPEIPLQYLADAYVWNTKLVECNSESDTVYPTANDVFTRRISSSVHNLFQGKTEILRSSVQQWFPSEPIHEVQELTMQRMEELLSGISL